MKTSIATSALLGVIATATQMRPEAHQHAQVGMPDTFSMTNTSGMMGLALCETYEEENALELDVQGCLEVLAYYDLNLELGATTTPELLYNDITQKQFDDWARRYTTGQAHCWLKYSDAYGYDSVNEWGVDPFLEGDHFSFLMPNSRKYEHFYNDPDCNQIFRMGRGRTQPDAITFNDVSAWDHNSLLITNRFSVTPWVSHDQMVIQMFGVTDQCVAVRVDEEASGRGLVNGTFRIEYKNATGLASVTGEDFYRTDLLTAPVTAGTGADSGLLEANVCIDRTPHYLSVCQDDPASSMQFDGACPDKCFYAPDFKSSDSSVHIDMYGNYTVPCSKHDVNTFNGTNSLDNSDTTTIEDQRVQALVFEDGCDADSFVLLDGQILNIQGNLTGPLEVEINLTAYPNNDDVIFEFYNDLENPWHAQTITKMDLPSQGSPMEPAEHSTGVRLFVYSQHNLGYVCYKPCTDSVAQDLECSSPSENSIPRTNFETDLQPEEFWSIEGGEAVTATTTDNEDGRIVSGLGNDMITGTEDELQILEDFGGNDSITADTADDLIISRSGGEIITGAGDGESTVQTVRIYPTHEKDHFFGAKNPEDLRQCTKMLDAHPWTNFELVLDDPWYPDAEYTNDDDYCALLVPGWELEWYWGSDWDLTDGQEVDIWFSRTGQADFCFSDSTTECQGPYEAGDDKFCLSYWVACDRPAAPTSGEDYGASYSVEDDLVSQAWSSWFGW